MSHCVEFALLWERGTWEAIAVDVPAAIGNDREALVHWAQVHLLAQARYQDAVGVAMLGTVDLSARELQSTAQPATASLSDTDRLHLIRQVFDLLFRETESFYNRTGGNLAYLLGGIASGTPMDFSEAGDREFVDCLRRRFPESHPLWIFVANDPDST